MPRVNIEFPGNLGQVDTPSELRRVPSYMADGDVLYVVRALGRAYSFDYSSLAVDDGADVIKPDDLTVLQAGRWIYEVGGFAAGPTGPANSTFTTLAALKAAPANNYSYILAANSRQDVYTYVTGDFTGQVDEFNIIKLDGVPLATGALKRVDSVLFAANFGVYGNAVADDTIPYQNFLDLCSMLGRRAEAGGLKIRTTGPLYANNVAVSFESPGLGTGEAGIYPSGSDYTAITFAGQCSIVQVTVIGSGGVGITRDEMDRPIGVIPGSDTRTDVVGVQLGTEDVPLIHVASVMIKAINLRRNGIRVSFLNDSVPGILSTELCGNVANPGGAQTEYFAIDLVNDGVGVTGSEAVPNMCSLGLIQPEQSVGRALRVDVGVLNVTATTVHIERTLAVTGDTNPERTVYIAGWFSITGGMKFQSFSTPKLGMTLYGQMTTLSNVVCDNTYAVVSANIGQSLMLNNVNGDIYSADASAGAIIVEGGSGGVFPGQSSNTYGASWLIRDRGISEWQMGGTSGEYDFILDNCSIGSITRLNQGGNPPCFATLRNCRGIITTTPHVDSRIYQVDGVITASGGALQLAYCYWEFSGKAKWIGSLSTDNAAIRGGPEAVLQGNFTHAAGPFASLWEGIIAGATVNWANPNSSGTRLGDLYAGVRNKNFANMGSGQPPEYIFTPTGWKAYAALV